MCCASPGPAEEISASDTGAWAYWEYWGWGEVYLMVLLLSSNLHLQASGAVGKHPRLLLNLFSFVHFFFFFNKSTDLDSEPHILLFTQWKYQHSSVLWAETWQVKITNLFSQLPFQLPSWPWVKFLPASAFLSAMTVLIFHICCEHLSLYSATFPEAQIYYRIFAMKV